MTEKSRFLVFTDLDGTLLDHATYSFAAAAPALRALEERGIPLVFCTSKTRAETERHRRAMGNAHPFIVENGGAAFVPGGYFAFDGAVGPTLDSYEVLVFGAPYGKIRQVLGEIRGRLGPAVRGFGDMSAAEVAGLCGFSAADASLARQREYDEPFLVGDEGDIATVREMAEAAGLRIVRGGRFFHLIGDSDKGAAVAALRRLYERAQGELTTIGIGDSLNDESMLRAVDVPVLVQKPGGRHDPDIKMPGLVFAPGVGPEGWREAVLNLIAQNDGRGGPRSG